MNERPVEVILCIVVMLLFIAYIIYYFKNLKKCDVCPKTYLEYDFDNNLYCPRCKKTFSTGYKEYKSKNIA